MLGVPELLVHQRVHADVHLLLLGHEEVALNHLLLDPVLERLPDDRRANIDHPLFWGLIQVWHVWQVILDHRVLHDDPLARVGAHRAERLAQQTRPRPPEMVVLGLDPREQRRTRQQGKPAAARVPRGEQGTVGSGGGGLGSACDRALVGSRN